MTALPPPFLPISPARGEASHFGGRARRGNAPETTTGASESPVLAAAISFRSSLPASSSGGGGRKKAVRLERQQRRYTESVLGAGGPFLLLARVGEGGFEEMESGGEKGEKRKGFSSLISAGTKRNSRRARRR